MAGRLRSPLVLLAVLSAVSFLARVAWLGAPCTRPCLRPADHTLVFDEVYYVNAARVIAGIAPPAGAHYAGDPAGEDPNAEHPQGVKLVVAALIELFGDGPFAWRIASVAMGSLAILGIFALARAAGAGRWPALAAAALMASDNLLLVAGRIGTLDVYAAAAMIWSATLYLRRRPLAAGVALGVGAACKEVAPYALLALALVEAGRWWRSRPGGARPGDAGGPGGGRRCRALRPPALRLAGCAAVAGAAFVALLTVMGWIAPPYDDSIARPLRPGPFHHVAHIVSFAAGQTSPNGPQGIASLPWEWLFDFKPIVYLNVNPAQPAPGLRDIHPAVHFLGVISPPMMLVALPALAVAAVAALRPGRASGWLAPEDASGTWALGDTPLVGVAWVLGTLGPYELQSLIWQRTSYLYYMVVVMPGLYLALAGLAVRARRHRRVLCAWVALVALALALMYPLTPLP
jgi:hypothetical protein